MAPAAEDEALTLDLQQALTRALRSNRALADSRDGLRSAGFVLDAAEAEFALRILPAAQVGYDGGSGSAENTTFGFSVDVTQRLAGGTVVGLRPGVQRFDGTWESSLRADVTQPLLRGRDPEFVQRGVAEADFGLRSAGRSLYATRVETVLATVRAVYRVVLQRETLRLNGNSAARLAGHVAAAEARERAGLASSIDVFRANLQREQALNEEEANVEALGDALDSLRLILALPVTSRLTVEAPLEYDLVRTGEVEAIRLALDSRIELDQVRDNLEQAQRRSRIASHNTLPDLDLGLSYTRFDAGSEFGDSLGLREGAFGVSLSSSTDLRRLAEKALYEQTRLDAGMALRSLETTSDLIARQVKSELRGLTRTERRIESQGNQVRQARGKLELARVKFGRGLASNFDLIEAEGEMRRAQVDLIAAVSDYIVGTYELRAALGTLVER